MTLPSKTAWTSSKKRFLQACLLNLILLVCGLWGLRQSDDIQRLNKQQNLKVRQAMKSPQLDELKRREQHSFSGDSVLQLQRLFGKQPAGP